MSSSSLVTGTARVGSIGSPQLGHKTNGQGGCRFGIHDDKVSPSYVAFLLGLCDTIQPLTRSASYTKWTALTLIPSTPCATEVLSPLSGGAHLTTLDLVLALAIAFPEAVGRFQRFPPS